MFDTRDAWLTTLHPQTRTVYRRATDLFIDWLHDGALHADSFERFALWLRNDHAAIHKPATVRAYCAGVVSYFEWLDDMARLPADFPFARALRRLNNLLQKRSEFTVSQQPPEPPPGIDEVITYYDTLPPPPRLKSEVVIARWERGRLRNRALMRALAESGGRVSEVLSLNRADFPLRVFTQGDVHRVLVVGKKRREYYLRFNFSLPYIKTYLEARVDDRAALFVRHSKSNEGDRLLRQEAYRIVSQAAKALGLGDIGPHQFRHRRATELRNRGVAIQDIAAYLGHSSSATTERFYAHVDHARIDKFAE
jgi:integrase